MTPLANEPQICQRRSLDINAPPQLPCPLLLRRRSVIVIFLQRDPSPYFQVYESLASIAPPGSISAPVKFGSKAEIYEWFASALLPTWDDPKCGDGACGGQWPGEFPAFGRFGCAADCGSAAVKTTLVRVEVSAAFSLNRLTTAAMQDLFLQRTHWNLCWDVQTSFPKVPKSLCWFERNQTFTAAVQEVSMELRLPDAEWRVVLNAPFGAVTGRLTAVSELPDGTTRNTTLVSWDRCKPPAEDGRASRRRHERRRALAAASGEGRGGAGAPRARGAGQSWVPMLERMLEQRRSDAVLLHAAGGPSEDDAAGALAAPRGQRRESLVRALDNRDSAASRLRARDACCDAL